MTSTYKKPKVIRTMQKPDDEVVFRVIKSSKKSFSQYPIGKALYNLTQILAEIK